MTHARLPFHSSLPSCGRTRPIPVTSSSTKRAPRSAARPPSSPSSWRAGGRAVDALRSITIGHYLFGLQNVVVVHHTNCGTSSFTPQGLLSAYHSEEGVDLSDTYDADSLAIRHLESSLKYDVDLLRESAAVPAAVNIVGYVFDIDANEFTLVIADTTH